MRFVKGLVGVAVLATMSFTMLPQAAAVGIDLHTRLQGSAAFPRATGHSEYDRSRTEREVEVIVQNIGRLAGHRVNVFVSGNKVGSMRVSIAGVAHREWDTERGDSVPFASAGDRVKVRTTGGKLVASGRYVREPDD
jgi:hypothetical protein